MANRLENLRLTVNEYLRRCEPDKVCAYSSHLYGVAKFCTLLALKRKLDAEIAATCGMLHDIYYVIGGDSENHAIPGAATAKQILLDARAYSDGEIEIITSAILHHSDKRETHAPYDELLKDADVMDHCFYNADFAIAEWETLRYNNLLAEFGIDEN